MFVNSQKLILLLGFLRTFYNSMSWGCPDILKSSSGMDVVSDRWKSIISFVQGRYPYWFQRHLNPKILQRDIQLPTIMAVQSNISLSSCLVVEACSTSFRLVLVYFESLQILVQSKGLNICFTAMKVHIKTRIGKETK